MDYAHYGVDAYGGRPVPNVDYVAVPYYEFALTAPGEPLLLNELVIGPCPDPDLAKLAVKELFRPSGDVLCDNMRCSTIPYRNW